MFQKDTYVFYGSGGICRISDICVAPLEGMPTDRTYYVLRSLYDKSGVTYVPTDSDSVFLRPLLTEAEACGLLEEISALSPIEWTDAKQLRLSYAETMGLHEPRAWVRVIKTVRLRASAENGRGKRLSETERGYAESARRYLVSELALALGCTEREAEEMLSRRL